MIMIIPIYKNVIIEDNESHNITNTPINTPTSVDVRVAQPGHLAIIRGQFLTPTIPTGPYTNFQDIDPMPSQNNNIMGQVAALNDAIINLIQLVGQLMANQRIVLALQDMQVENFY